MLHLYAHEISLRNPFVEKYSFNLTKTDIDRLERNIEITRNFIKSSVLFRAGNIDFPLLLWNWVYPAIERIKN